MRVLFQCKILQFLYDKAERSVRIERMLIYSHELNYIGATTCFMSLGQSSGN